MYFDVNVVSFWRKLLPHRHVTGSSETSVSFCQTAQRHITKDFIVTAMTALNLTELFL